MAYHRELHQYKNDNAVSRTERTAQAEVPGRCVPAVCLRQRTGGGIVIGFILGGIFGGTIGVVAMCLCVAAKEADCEMGCTKYEDDFQ